VSPGVAVAGLPAWYGRPMRPTLLAFVLLSACGGSTPASPAGSPTPTPTPAPTPTATVPAPTTPAPTTPAPTTPPTEEWPWSDDPCATVSAPDAVFESTIARFEQLDDLAAPPAGGLVITGSSSIRRWESASRLLSAYEPVQRGFGGARLADLAVHADRLILRHDPAAVLVFAGTNDLADGRSVDDVLTAYRCLADRVHELDVPLLWVGITPTPARWAGWPDAETVNAEVERLSSLHPDLHYVDIPTPFLATGSPPEAGLFVDDHLHLSETGYGLWDQVVGDAVAAVVSPVEPPHSPPPSGTYLRVDLGPTNPDDGDPAPAVDAFGIHWNSWHGVDGEAQILAGQALRDLVSTTGAPTTVALTIAGGFRSNGKQNGGLWDPTGDDLGTMAVPEATVDFFYTGGADDPGGISFSGLDPAASHTLRLFASRSSAERRVSRFVVHGASQAETALVTSGAGTDGGQANIGTVAVLTGLVPDTTGRLHVDVQIAEGSYAYLNLVELEVE